MGRCVKINGTPSMVTRKNFFTITYKGTRVWDQYLLLGFISLKSETNITYYDNSMKIATRQFNLFK